MCIRDRNFNNSQDEIHVNFYYYLWADMFTKLITEYVSGEPADIICVHPFEIGQYAERGLYDPEQVKKLGLKAEDYSEAVWNGTFYQGVQYAAPFDTHMPVSYTHLVCLKCCWWDTFMASSQNADLSRKFS